MFAAVRFLLPVAAAVASALYIAAAVPHGLDLALAEASTEAQDSPGQLARCVAGGRDAHACLDEADGKALVERAEWLARADDAARRGSPR